MAEGEIKLARARARHRAFLFQQLLHRKAAAFDALLEAMEGILDWHQVTHCHAAARAAIEAAKTKINNEK